MVMQRKMEAGQAKLQEEEVSLKKSKESSIKHEQADLVVASESPCHDAPEVCAKRKAEAQRQWFKDETLAKKENQNRKWLTIVTDRTGIREREEKDTQRSTQAQIDQIAIEEENRRREAEERHTDLDLISPGRAGAGARDTGYFAPKESSLLPSDQDEAHRRAVESWEKASEKSKVWFGKAKKGEHTKKGETVLEKQARLHRKIRDIEKAEQKTYQVLIGALLSLYLCILVCEHSNLNPNPIKTSDHRSTIRLS